MNLQGLYEELTKVNHVGIDEVVVSPVDEETVHFSGINENRTIVVFSDLSNKDRLTDNAMGIHSVSTLLKRLNLFDLDKVNETVDDNESFVKRLGIKQGKMNVSYTFSDPSNCQVPKTVSKDDIISTIRFDKDTFGKFQKAMSAMVTGVKDATIRFEGRDSEVHVTVHDGVSDAYNDVLGDNTSDEDWGTTTLTKSVEVVLKESLKYSDEVTLNFGSHGLIYVLVDGLEFIILPHIED